MKQDLQIFECIQLLDKFQAVKSSQDGKSRSNHINVDTETKIDEFGTTAQSIAGYLNLIQLLVPVWMEIQKNLVGRMLEHHECEEISILMRERLPPERHKEIDEMLRYVIQGVNLNPLIEVLLQNFTLHQVQYHEAMALLQDFQDLKDREDGVQRPKINSIDPNMTSDEFALKIQTMATYYRMLWGLIPGSKLLHQIGVKLIDGDEKKLLNHGAPTTAAIQHLAHKYKISLGDD